MVWEVSSFVVRGLWQSGGFWLSLRLSYGQRGSSGCGALSWYGGSLAFWGALLWPGGSPVVVEGGFLVLWWGFTVAFEFRLTQVQLDRDHSIFNRPLRGPR